MSTESIEQQPARRWWVDLFQPTETVQAPEGFTAPATPQPSAAV